MEHKIIFIDGKFCRVDAAALNELTPGHVDQDGVFETMRVYSGTRIFGYDEHMKRFSKGLKKFRLKCWYTSAEMKQLITQLFKKNKISEAGVRVSCWKEGRLVRFAIVARPLLAWNDPFYQRGMKTIIFQEPFRKNKLSAIKSLRYSFYRQAFLCAQKYGAQEALLADQNDVVVEGSRSNVFVVRQGVLFTPALRSGCLDGVTRRCVIKLARELKISCRVSTVLRKAFFSADEIFITNSLMEIMPVTWVDGKKISQGKAGAVTQRVLGAYRARAAQR
jgi:branched-subunit amino acid aminotransferase/4-amino-4-deoxychorismate lyase